METRRTRQFVLASACSAMCMLLWHLNGLIPGAGSMYSVIYLPIQLCAVCCGVGAGLLCAVVGVLLPAVFGAVPGALWLPGVFTEHLILAFVSATVLRHIYQNGERHRFLWGLLFCFLLSRIGGSVTVIFLYSPEPAAMLPSLLMVTAYVATGMPGLLISLVLFPKLLSVLSDSGLLPYENDVDHMSSSENNDLREKETPHTDDPVFMPAAYADSESVPEKQETDPEGESGINTQS